MTVPSFHAFIRKVTSDIVTVSYGLFRVMIPTLIVVKIATELGLDQLLIMLFQPFMAVMGLPPEIAIILVTCLLTNPYAGLIVAASVPEVTELTMGQASVMTLFMLFTHGLPVEVMVARKVGVRARISLAIRLCAGFLSGFILGPIFAITGWLSEPASLNLPQIQLASDFASWLISQINALMLIQLVIIVLLIFLEILRIIGVERIIGLLLRPVLHLMGIGDRASTIGIVGVCLGLSFGGGLLMKDVKTGTIAKKDVFGIVCFINLIHSIFEDTAVVMLLGPSLFVIVGFRLLFSVLLTFCLMKLASRLSDANWHRWLTNANIPLNAG